MILLAVAPFGQLPPCCGKVPDVVEPLFEQEYTRITITATMPIMMPIDLKFGGALAFLGFPGLLESLEALDWQAG